MTANPMRLACLAATLLLATQASAAQPPASEIVELSLEDLMQVEVTTVSKKPQALADVAAAAYVISQDDIRRSGARSIPEALRLAPGVDVARLSGNRWSVTMRGFNERFANKLLVLVDGRNAYTPVFSGMLWETLLFPLEDIERIEVIRGPGGSVWGTNAVNGVINIITKTAWSTTGGGLTAGVGSREGSFGSLRYGAPFADGSTAYRAYASGLHNNALESASGASARDSDEDFGAGFRLDGITRGGDSWSVSGDFYQTRSNTQATMIDPTLLTASTSGFREAIDGGSLRARWERRLNDDSAIQVQAALAYTDLWVPYLAGDQRTTFDLDFQHQLRAAGGHDITWGAGYRRSDDSTSNSDWMVFSSKAETLHVASLFAQDEIALPRALRLTLGARLDHYNTTGTAFQPSARLLWNIDPGQSAWLAASRAVRTPSRGESTVRFLAASATLPGPLTVPVYVQGSSAFDNEKLTAYEAGYRTQLTPRLAFDANVFLHKYTDLRSDGALDYSALPAYITLPMENAGKMRLYGLEAAADWRLSETWRLKLSYGYTDSADIHNEAFAASLIPKHLANLRLSWNPTAKVDLDFWLRHASERPSTAADPENRVPAYTTLDIRLAWRPEKALELSLVGQDLLDSRHLEFANDQPQILPTYVPRGLYGQVRWEF